MNNEAQSFYHSYDNAAPEISDDLWQYVQSMTPDMVSQMSKPQSDEVLQVMERNITGLLGNLPKEGVNVAISMNRENLGRLLASAMMSGYFLRNAEQRLNFEKALQTQEID